MISEALEKKILKMPHEQAVRAVQHDIAKKVAYEQFKEINAARVEDGLEPFASKSALLAFFIWYCQEHDAGPDPDENSAMR